jgi:hypothetical protein
MGDSIGDFHEGSRTFGDHDLGSAVDLAGKGDEATYLLIDIG